MSDRKESANMEKHAPWKHTFDEYGDEVWFGGKDEGLFSVICPAFDAVAYFGSGCNHTARRELLTQLAEFIVDAGNVYSETGLTARELLKQRDALVKAVVSGYDLPYNPEGKMLCYTNDEARKRAKPVSFAEMLCHTNDTEGE